MTATLSLSEYQERTYIKQIGDFTLSCDRSQLSDHESSLSAEEEAEALQLLEQAMALLKNYLYVFGMRRSNPLFVDTKSGKRVNFVVTDEYWEQWCIAEGARLDEKDQIKEEAKKKQEDALEKAKKRDGVMEE
ncbi:hypothetical protein BGZ82_008799 [Podila clonocystis]|nr:hypothetical protein BGZ82_008799 [Podila clonocystis]